MNRHHPSIWAELSRAVVVMHNYLTGESYSSFYLNDIYLSSHKNHTQQASLLTYCSQIGRLRSRTFLIINAKIKPRCNFLLNMLSDKLSPRRADCIRLYRPIIQCALVYTTQRLVSAFAEIMRTGSYGPIMCRRSDKWQSGLLGRHGLRVANS